VQAGESAPDFNLPALHRDGFVSLGDYRGKSPLLLAIFRGLWCSFCRRQLAQLSGTRQKLQAVGVETLAIVASKLERARLYCRFHPAPVPLATDPELATHRAYGLIKPGLESEFVAIVDTMRISLPEFSEPRPVLEVSDIIHRRYPFEWTDSDREDYERATDQMNGVFLVDSEGIVRWTHVECAEEGAAGVFKFPSDDELLAAARELSGRAEVS
jgi:peroxiredoxin